MVIYQRPLQTAVPPSPSQLHQNRSFFDHLGRKLFLLVDWVQKFYRDEQSIYLSIYICMCMLCARSKFSLPLTEKRLGPSMSLCCMRSAAARSFAGLRYTAIGLRGQMPRLVLFPYHHYSTNASADPPQKEPLWQRVKHEVRHYVNGTKLLGYEIKVSTKLLLKFSQGYELSRREQNQLKRTMSDVFRLIPFSAFVIIPFAELLLPIALKIFPNLLPSTYESKKDKQAKRNKLIETRQKTSLFLHETLEESSLLSYNSIQSAEKKKKFLNFFTKLYNAKQNSSKVSFTHQEILAISTMFKNDTILDNLSRPQLIAISKFISIRPFGSDNILRYQIRHKLKNIMQDDKILAYEGIGSLSAEELYQACVSRGIKAYGVSHDDLVNNLQVWLDLRLKEKVPSVLMVLSSTFTFGGVPQKDAIKSNFKITSSTPEEHKHAPTKYDELLELYYFGVLQVLSSIPDPVYNVAKLDVAESKVTEKAPEAPEAPVESPTTEVVSEEKVITGGEAEQPAEVKPTSDDNEFKLNVLKEQQELIKKEEEEAKKRKDRETVSDDIHLDEEEPQDKSEDATKEKTKSS